MACCPVCSHEGAYVGAVTVECPSVGCKHFSERQYKDWLATRPTEPAQEMLDSVDPVDHSLYLWCSRFNDFGD